MKAHGIFFLTALALFASCSSQPKRAMQFTDIRKQADYFYESANTFIVLGDFEKAGSSLSSALNLAVSVDDCDLASRACLSAVTLFLSAQDAFPRDSWLDGKSAQELLAESRKFSARTERPALLGAAAEIYECRILAARKDVSAREADEKIARLGEIYGAVKKNSFYEAHYFRVMGDLHTAKGDYASAEKSYRQAASIHLKSRWLYETALDWYLVARCLSLAGNKPEAVKAIETALKYDRDAENTRALGQDYYALALILIKDGCTAREKSLAKEAALRSWEIYSAGKFEREAQRSKALMERIGEI